MDIIFFNFIITTYVYVYVPAYLYVQPGSQKRTWDPLKLQLQFEMPDISAGNWTQILGKSAINQSHLKQP